jgi:hypothetical protein
MTSIIKVDQIQTLAGTAPTAADLGINVTGTTLQTVQHSWNTTTTVESSTYIDAAGSSFSFTPKSASSTLLISGSMAIHMFRPATGGGGTFVLVHDGTILGYQGNTYEHYVSEAGSTSYDNYSRSNKQDTVAAGSTSPRNILVRIAGYNGSFEVNQGSIYRSYITITEIAG